MFDIGFSEIFIVAIIALLVLGPERLPRAARFTGLWVRRARAQWYSVKAELESELADDELKRSLLRTQEELREIRAEMHNQGRELKDDLRRESEDIEQAIKSPASSSLAAVPEPLADTGVGNGTTDDDVTGVFNLEEPLADMDEAYAGEPAGLVPNESLSPIDDEGSEQDTKASARGTLP